LSTSPSANRSERQGLRVRFTHVNGRLRASDRPTGFELRPLAGQLATPIIYRVDLEPSGCLLHLNRPMTDSALLYHGAGLMPYVNITDEQDMSIPAFGPIKVTLPTSEADKPSKNQ